MIAFPGKCIRNATFVNHVICQTHEWMTVSVLSLLIIYHQGEHRPQPGPSNHPWSQVPYQPLLQWAGQFFWYWDHTRVPEDACPQEEPQLFPYSHLFSGVRAYYHSLYMCHFQAKLNRTDYSDVLWHWQWPSVCRHKRLMKERMILYMHCICFQVDIENILLTNISLLRGFESN